MKCKYSISVYRISRVHKGLYFPVCPFSDTLRCARVYTEEPFCPFKEYDWERIPPIVRLEKVVCRYKRSGKRTKNATICIFDSRMFCKMKGSGPCPNIVLEQSLNGAHDEVVREIWGEVDEWITKTLGRERKALVVSSQSIERHIDDNW